jgi:hypothetical protein
MNYEPRTNRAGVTQTGRVIPPLAGLVAGSLNQFEVCWFVSLKRPSNSRLTNCFSAGVTQTGRVIHMDWSRVR